MAREEAVSNVCTIVWPEKQLESLFQTFAPYSGRRSSGSGRPLAHLQLSHDGKALMTAGEDGAVFVLALTITSDEVEQVSSPALIFPNF